MMKIYISSIFHLNELNISILPDDSIGMLKLILYANFNINPDHTILTYQNMSLENFHDSSV